MPAYAEQTSGADVVAATTAGTVVVPAGGARVAGGADGIGAESLVAAVRSGNVCRVEAALERIDKAPAAVSRPGGAFAPYAARLFGDGVRGEAERPAPDDDNSGNGGDDDECGRRTAAEKHSLLDARDADGHAALHWAALDGQTRVISMLIDAGACVDVRSVGADQHGQTPLMWACVGGRLDAAALLVRRGADPAAADERGYTPMVHAVQYGFLHIVHWLAQLRPRRSRAAGMPAVMWTAEAEESEQRDAGVGAWSQHAPRLSSSSPSSSSDEEEVVLEEEEEEEELIRVIDHERHTLLHWASYREHLSVVQYLLVCHALETNAQDAAGMTPLHRALQRNNLRISRTLLRRGALDTARNKSGLRPHELALEKGHVPLSEYVAAWARLGREPDPYAEVSVRALTRNPSAASAPGGGGGGGGNGGGGARGKFASRAAMVAGAMPLCAFVKRRIVYGRYGLRLHGLVYFYYYVLAASVGMLYRWFLAANGGATSPLFLALHAMLVVNAVSSAYTTYGDPGSLSGFPPRVLLSMLPAADLKRGGAAVPLRVAAAHREQHDDDDHGRRLMRALFDALTDARNVTRYFCFTCMNIKPPRAKHCVLLDKCVARYDHYCPWMGNTIGAKNHFAFLLCLCSLLWLQASYVYMMVRPVFFDAAYPYGVAALGLRGVVATMPQAVLLLACTSVLALLVLPMAVHQVYLYYVADLTTNESVNYERYTYLTEKQMRAAMCSQFGWWTRRGLCGCCACASRVMLGMRDAPAAAAAGVQDGASKKTDDDDDDGGGGGHGGGGGV